MKPINKDELFDHMSGFLKRKGIELKDGSYTQRIQKGVHLLADAVNLSQKGLQRAKAEIDKGLGKMRQVIHEKTAPNTVANPFASAPSQSVPPPAPSRKPSARKKPSSRKKRG
jgi:hypothetical protein